MQLSQMGQKKKKKSKYKFPLFSFNFTGKMSSLWWASQVFSVQVNHSVGLFSCLKTISLTFFGSIGMNPAAIFDQDLSFSSRLKCTMEQLFQT